MRKGQNLQALLVNRLPVETTVHWHGVAIRNDMDGVPGMTQDAGPGRREFTYSFAVAEPGTYWYHPHVGVQLDRGLYGPLIVEDPAEPADYDHDWTVVLDDWIDGTATPRPGPGRPGTAWAACQWRHGRLTPMMSGMRHERPPPVPLLGGDAGDVALPLLPDQRPIRTAPRTFTARPGQRARIRFINAGRRHRFRVALGGHR